jgi:hypothetical protein
MFRKILTAITPLLVSTGMALEPADDAADDAAPPPMEAARGIAIGNLLAERRSPEALGETIEQARKAGVSDQAVLEARFLFHVDRGEDGKIAAMAPELLNLRDSFKEENSIAFAAKDDWLAIVEYAQALAALETNDKPRFKSHITEAFWLSPQQGAAFAPHIERFRLAEAMRGMKIDFSLELKPIPPEKNATSLANIAKDRKALLLHFWSPESAVCVDSLPDFATTATMLTGAGIAVVSLAPEGGPETLTQISGLIGGRRAASNGSWMLDSLEKPLSRKLRVRNLPTVVLISTDGSVLFNGSPSDPEFWSSAIRIDPSIRRPASTVSKGDREEN